MQTLLNQYTPYQEDDFITCNIEYDFSYSIKFHYFLYIKNFEIPEEFKDWISIEETEEILDGDISILEKFRGEENTRLEIEEEYENSKKPSGRYYYVFSCSSRRDEDGNIQNVDDITFLLNKGLEFLDYLKTIRGQKSL